MHSKQIYEPKETFKILLSTEINLLPTKPLFPCVSQGPLLKTLKGHIKVLGHWCWLFLVWKFPRNGIDSTLKWVSLESLWLSSPLLLVLCSDRGPSIPSLGFEPKDTTCPFHFSLPLDFDMIFNESFLFFLLSRIHVSDFFPNYLLGRPCPFQDLLGYYIFLRIF